ncbi:MULTISPECIES: hypothetical protein [unclassified Gordonia (in: high G+C Gram-positive bacteria)]
MPGFSDDDLEEFYRRVEARTDLTPPRRRRVARPRPPCPTPDKDAFGSERSAREGIDRITESGRRSLALRCYRCACGAWHITSSPPRDEPPRSSRRRGSRAR